jgi:hypothetical protein
MRGPGLPYVTGALVIPATGIYLDDALSGKGRWRRRNTNAACPSAVADGVELKDMVSLAFHEFFERRDYLPTETT